MLTTDRFHHDRRSGRLGSRFRRGSHHRASVLSEDGRGSTDLDTALLYDLKHGLSKVVARYWGDLSFGLQASG